jgi:hypothetical protein
VTAPAVIVRTFSAGVHYGHLSTQSEDGKRITLTGARRIWSWKGANTLNEIANHGPGPGSRISERVQEIALTEAIEVITCSPAGEQAMESATWTP